MYIRSWGLSCKPQDTQHQEAVSEAVQASKWERALCCLSRRLFQAHFLTCLHRRKRSKRYSWGCRPGQWCSDWTQKSRRCRWSSSSHSPWTQGAWVGGAVKGVRLWEGTVIGQGWSLHSGTRGAQGQPTRSEERPSQVPLKAPEPPSTRTQTSPPSQTLSSGFKFLL